MLKSRIILLVTAIALVLLLFNLPKVVVDNDPEKVTSSVPSTEPEVSVADSSIHIPTISKDLADKAAGLKEKLTSSANKEKSTIFADSLAQLYLSVKKYDSAAKFIEIIAENNPEIESWINAGNAFYEAYGFAMEAGKRNFLGEKARFYFNKVLEESPQNNEVKNKIAMTFLSTSNPMQGILMLRQILEEDPGNENALFNLGVLSMQSNQYDKAVERFSSLTKLYPKNLEAIYFLGVSYFNVGESTKAREQFLLVKSLDKSPEVQASVDQYLEDIK